eukprot:TRINITY_DN2762_c0_g1_i1.p1 TRINITY_DN2762_c0_g1~~TRINITY_DN2762_c0_g1_i1.p1  ORF type:complete len:231 (-),score=23.75 TRINITY_DN2762_c0_g1_i1:153-845(-)
MRNGAWAHQVDVCFLMLRLVYQLFDQPMTFLRVLQALLAAAQKQADAAFLERAAFQRAAEARDSCELDLRQQLEEAIAAATTGQQELALAHERLGIERRRASEAEAELVRLADEMQNAQEVDSARHSAATGRLQDAQIRIAELERTKDALERELCAEREASSRQEVSHLRTLLKDERTKRGQLTAKFEREQLENELATVETLKNVIGLLTASLLNGRSTLLTDQKQHEQH